MKLNLILATALLSALSATPAAAQVDLLSPDQGLMIWTLIVFVVVLVLLGKFAFPHILGAVEEREQAIRDLIEEAKEDRAKAAALLERQQEEFDATRGRTQKILAESREAAERARDEMIAETRQQQEEMLERTRREIATQVEGALQGIRRDAVDLALAAAERLVRENLDNETNRRLVESYLAEVETTSEAPVSAGV